MRVEEWENRELYDAIRRSGEQTRAQLSDGFNRVAAALLALTTEIKGLREDLVNPHLDKPAKLSAPKEATP